MNSELKEALDRAEVLHEKLSVFQRLEAALLAWAPCLQETHGS